MFDQKLFTCIRSRRHSARSQPAVTPPVVPLPVVNDQPPAVLVFDHRDLVVDLAYEKHYTPGGPLVRSASRETTLYWIPRLTPVFVVSGGSVLYAQKQSDGHAIVIDHGNDWLSVYSGIEHMFVTPTDRFPRRETQLTGGDILGYLGATKAGRLRPLHFELWRCNRLQDYEQVDPIRYLRRWHQLGWNDSKLEPSPQVA